MLALTGLSPAAAQSYPDKPIRIIVAVAAGGPMDTMARAIAQQMQARLGQPVVVENRPGAGTTIGAKAVVNAEPDGLTLLWGTLSMVAIAPVLYKDLDFDPKALVPVALVAEFPSVMVIPPSLPAQTMAEFIAYAKANRGKMNYGGSLGTPPQLMGAMFNKVADLGMTYVPYRGGAPSMPDLIAGRLHMQFDALTLLVPLVKDGKLRALAVQTPTRWPDLPDVPTLREAGFADFPGNAWAGIMAPPKTPQLMSSASSTPPSTTSCARPMPRRAWPSSMSCCGRAPLQTSPPSSPGRRRFGRRWCGNPAPRRSSKGPRRRPVTGLRLRSSSRGCCPVRRTKFSSCAKSLRFHLCSGRNRLRNPFKG